ncbi:MAG: hypothetical protein EON55_15355, partial [Alphaproteobacteria bacterium]
MRALYAAATGMAAQELNVQVISNNIANLRTTGYKRQQPHFQVLVEQILEMRLLALVACGAQVRDVVRDDLDVEFLGR